MAAHDIPGSGQQLGSPTQRRTSVPLDERRRMRHEARTSQTYKAFLKYLRDVGQLPSEQAAEDAAISVLCVLEQRLVGEEDNDLEAQLPMKLRELMVRCDRHEAGPPPQKFGRAEMLAMVAEDLDMDPDDTEPIIRAVFSAIQAQISTGESDDIGGELPPDLRDLWVHPA
ncbi:DUF2267 domain-containing protein [Corallococcus carmarthensis]|uniref:DUF2267 domain-containing protein n=1 Tax=Corallococcus carmarthensis TaxID=2316728 RepID=UPI00148D98EE|nr:DUF2267 domain-containing protein [Corallococcus carmarthensis]NOK22387.1 DUF2267 domain-containing protein [Corallococcus carmarthensis]